MSKIKRLGTIVLVLIMTIAVTVSVDASPAAWPSPGPGSADVTVMNVGSGPASVTAEYIDAAGNVVVTRSASNLPVNGAHEFLSSNSGLPDGWQGAMVLSSTDIVASVATIRWAGGVDAGDDGDNGQYSGITTGSSTVYCPAVYQANGALYSTLAIQNTGAATANVQLSFRDRNGVAYAGNPVNKTIPANAQTTLNMSTEPQYFASNDGSALITSNQPVAVVATTHWFGRSSAYNCPTQGNTKLYVPAQYRSTNGGTASNDYILYSANVVMNLSSTTPANVVFHYIPRNPANASLDVPIQIPPLSAKGLNTQGGGSVPASTFNVLGTGWDGVVVIDSDQPLVGINNTNWGPAAGVRSATFKIIGPADGAQLVFLPHQRRTVPGGVWQEWSAAIVQNLTDSTANVTLRYYDAAGVEKLVLANQAIPARTAYGFNTRGGGSVSPDVFLPLGDAYAGGLRITSDQNIAVVAQYITAGAAKVAGSAYNGIPPQ
jgi:hypothetical protein